jgi:CATRA-associated small protein
MRSFDTGTEETPGIVPAADLLAILEVVDGLRLTEESWADTERALARAEASLFQGGVPATIVGEVETATGRRIGMAGSEPLVPAPAVVRERLNRLVHRLSEEDDEDGGR